MEQIILCSIINGANFNGNAELGEIHLYWSLQLLNYINGSSYIKKIDALLCSFLSIVFLMKYNVM